MEKSKEISLSPLDVAITKKTIDEVIGALPSDSLTRSVLQTARNILDTALQEQPKSNASSDVGAAKTH